MLTKTSIEIDLVECEPLGSLPDVSDDPEHKNDGNSQASHEKVSGITIAFLACRADGGEELAAKNGETKSETEPRTPNTSSGPERDLLEATALTLPCPAETNMGLESSKSRDSKEPVEHQVARRCKDDVGKGTPGKIEDNRDERASRSIDISKDLGSVVLLSESSESSGATIDGGDTNRDDGDTNDEVHEIVIALQTSIGDGEHKGRDTIFHTDKGKTNDVEAAVCQKRVITIWECWYLQGDTPKDLLDSTGKSLGRVARLSSGQTDQLSSSEGESSSNKDTTEATAAILEGTGIIPELGTLVSAKIAIRRTATTDKHDGDNHEDDDGSKLEAGAPKLFLGISQCAKHINYDDEKPEHSDPDRFVDIGVPVFRKLRFNGTYVVPTHGETPGRIDEASRVGIEATRDRVHDSEFTKSVDDVEDHDTSDGETDKDGTWTTLGEGTTGTDEETSTDRASNSDHVEMALLHGAIEFDDAGTVVTFVLAKIIANTLNIASESILCVRVGSRRWRDTTGLLSLLVPRRHIEAEGDSE
ncbi:hypothetical protein HG530_000425 [Fusarium avenaceum]|nr:hypothetical protein HG530_000425 [Fusarium avenaceum]